MRLEEPELVTDSVISCSASCLKLSLDIFRVKLVQQALLESQEVQDSRECRVREAYQDLRDQRVTQ